MSFYSSFDLDPFTKVAPVFEKRYPGVKVEHVRASSTALGQRLGTEARGGRVLADVLEMNSYQMYAVMTEGHLDSWIPPEASALPSSMKDQNGFWVTTRQTTSGVAFNTSLVPPAEQPKSFEDLTDPKWKGKLLVEVDDYPQFGALVNGHFKGDIEKATAWLRGVAANEPEPQKGALQVAELLAAGHRPVFLGAVSTQVDSLRGRGAPVDYMKTQLVQRLVSGGIVKSGPHPNAAKLFLNWFLSKEGQQAIADVGFTPARSDMTLEPKLAIPAGAELSPARPEIAKDDAKWREIWTSVLGIK